VLPWVLARVVETGHFLSHTGLPFRQMSAEEDNDVATEHYKLLFGVRRSVRYHMRRVSFFYRAHKWLTVLAATGGVGTITALVIGSSQATLVFGGVTAFFSVIDLVFNLAKRAREHNDLARRFIDLEKELFDAEEGIDRMMLADLTGQRLSIEKDEPPVLRVLDIICHNELVTAMDCGEEYEKRVMWFQRLCADFFDILPYKEWPNIKS